MALPTTRQGFIDYCLRSLGAPVLSINVDDEQIEEFIRCHHPYDLPECIALPVTAGSTEYLQWIQDQVV